MGVTLRRGVRAGLSRIARTTLGRRTLAVVLEDPDILRQTLNGLSDRIAAEGFVETAIPDGLDSINSFEDCAWLLSSNVLNHYAARLMISEAAHLYATTRALGGDKRIVEVGRYRGGTTLLLAAAGGRVLSIDNDAAVAESDASLQSALGRLGLLDRCDLKIEDSSTASVPRGEIDLVFIDGDHTYAGVKRDVEHWLPALRPGGLLILHDGRELLPAREWNAPPDQEVLGVRRAAAELRLDPSLVEDLAPGTLVQFRVRGDAAG